jgi:Flp pilus assembly protein protease CpaA
MILYVISYAIGVSGSRFVFGLSISVIVFAITLILNRYSLIGGGDVKLLFPLLLFAENNMYAFMIAVSVSGIVLSCIYIIFGKYIFFLRKKIITYLIKLNKTKKKFPLLNITLLSLGRISKRAVLIKQRTISTLKQEIPYGVALSCGGFYVIMENLSSR